MKKQATDFCRGQKRFDCVPLDNGAYCQSLFCPVVYCFSNELCLLVVDRVAVPGRLKDEDRHADCHQRARNEHLSYRDRPQVSGRNRQVVI